MNVPASHKETKEKILPIGSAIAHSLALGLELGDIAVQYSIPLETVIKVSRGNLVKKRVREIQEELSERFIEEAAASPVIQYAKQKGLRAIQRASEEMDNFEKEETGATASTRIQAAKLVLEVGGNLVKEKEHAASPIIMISADKVNLGNTIINNHVEAQPDYVDH